jgi:hypothetical protein
MCFLALLRVERTDVKYRNAAIAAGDADVVDEVSASASKLFFPGLVPSVPAVNLKILDKEELDPAAIPVASCCKYRVFAVADDKMLESDMFTHDTLLCAPLTRALVK